MNRRSVNNQIFHHPWSGTWLNLGKGVLLALLISLVMILAIALLLYLTALPEKAAPYLTYAVGTVAILWGSAHAARKIGARGWLNGGIVGSIFVLLMLGGGLIVVDDMTVGWGLLIKVFLGFVFGAVGGMWGINY